MGKSKKKHKSKKPTINYKECLLNALIELIIGLILILLDHLIG